MDEVKRTVYSADILILVSPVHFRHVSSVFQNFVERLLVDLHTFECLGKPYINFVTTNGSGEDDAEKYLTKIGYLLGAIKIGKICKSDNDRFTEIRFPRKNPSAYKELLHTADTPIKDSYKIEIIGDEIFISEKVLNILFVK